MGFIKTNLRAIAAKEVSLSTVIPQWGTRYFEVVPGFRRGLWAKSRPAGRRAMGKVTRKPHSAQFEARVALEAIRGKQTLAEIGSRHGLHLILVLVWKKAAIGGLAGTFSAKAANTLVVYGNVSISAQPAPALGVAPDAHGGSAPGKATMFPLAEGASAPIAIPRGQSHSLEYSPTYSTGHPLAVANLRFVRARRIVLTQV